MSRRELLKLVLPRRKATPAIVRESCPGSLECGLCMGVCPRGAITASEARIELDSLVCTGCGACAMICPRHAVDYVFTPASADAAIASALTGDAQPVVAFFCDACLPTSGSGKEAKTAYEGVVTLPVPCHVATSPWLVLRALERGAGGVALVADCARCKSGYSLEKLSLSMKFVRELLECSGSLPERVRIILPGANRDDMKNILADFATGINELGRLPSAAAEISALPGDGLLLPALVRGLSARYGAGKAVVVRGEEIPFGMVTLDASRCTGCGLCISRCSTEAISASRADGKDSFQLLFQYDRCTACGQCKEVCPEGCLKIEHILDTGKLAEPPAVLFVDDVARCRECGGIIGPAAMLNSLRKKLSGPGGGQIEHLSLCPACRARHFRLGRVAGKGLTSAGR